MSETIPRAGFTLLIRCCLFYANNQPRIRGDHSIDSTRDAYQGDHPRMRGDHMTLDRLAAIAEGSSPHARGPPRLPRSCRTAIRIIPAREGTTPARGRGRRRNRDHPRMRGDHASAHLPAYSDRGSSPHARGPLRVYLPLRARHGIIPACAGTTRSSRARLAPCRDHPRMRGDHG